MCTNCGYDFVEGARTPAVTLRRGLNPVSLAVGLLALVLLGAIVSVTLSQ